ncbi:pyrroloquinoline quinone-dependent dehydrogenase [Chitinophaga silvatica]|uniref:Pyrroloquinoline quinone-dependent dehydrogenase n=1 Tax=Chitinophaga silvatica TaxID=2282649 RepID=A0A3E1Y662_9BACT|nr:pyrroloquinoline quinone-dependent dehydrogenase [Chitinophaga silvatica]
MIRRGKLLLLICFTTFYSACGPGGAKKYTDWKVTGGSRENVRYSSLNQIDTSNVDQLNVAWVYYSEKQDSSRYGSMQCNPIVVDNTLFGVSPKLKLFALDAATGVEKWSFNPADTIANKTWHRSSVNMNRGVAYWADGDDKRIIYTVGSVALCVNAQTGKLVTSFGKDGGIDLRNGLDRDSSKVFVAPTSPVMIYKDLFFLSGLVGEETPGHIRAFDVRTGKQKWIFHTIPYPGEPGYETWEDSTAYKYMGSTNSWSGFSLDEKRGILYAPTGNPTNDFYGGQRRGAGLYGNCILALDAATGKLIWHFQTVHHDVWDMDLSSPPVLVTIKKDGKAIDAVVQSTKTGLIFILNRETGEPIYPIEERAVDTTTALAREQLWPTQPFPTLPKPFARHTLTEADLNRLVDDSSYQDILTRFRSYRAGSIFTPPSKEGTVVFPGYDGGGEWGGPSVDPETNVLYVNANEMAWVLNIIDNNAPKEEKRTKLEAGAAFYNQYCMGCHGPERMGGGDYPSIIGVENKYNYTRFLELLSTGRRMMPGFNNLDSLEKDAIASFILNIKQQQNQEYKGRNEKRDAPPRALYGFTGYHKFLTKEGYPAISPPWGTISAINLNSGEYLWKIPFGEFEELSKKGIPETGRENYGGPVTTAGGILFIGASADGYMRAYNKRTGALLWKVKLPAPGVATPAIYSINGKQYVVIACGGSKWGGQSSDAYVAFALPGK